MFINLTNSDIQIAQQIHFVFQKSYQIEAQILQAIDFPPLKRSIHEISQSHSLFVGYQKQGMIVAVVEIKENEECVHIQSLVVLPEYFKQGIASKIMLYVLSQYNGRIIMVETGVKNIPAINLYEKFRFKQIKQWDTDHGVRKVRLIKHPILESKEI